MWYRQTYLQVTLNLNRILGFSVSGGRRIWLIFLKRARSAHSYKCALDLQFSYWK